MTCLRSSFGRVLDFKLTGSESPVRAASGAGYLLTSGMVSGRAAGVFMSRRRQLSGAGRFRLCGHGTCSFLDYAGYMEFADRTVGVRT